MIHKATQLIMESFDRHGVLYRVTETDEVYKGTGEWVRNAKFDEKELTKYIIGTFSGYERPMSPAGKAGRSFDAWISGRTYGDVVRERAEMLGINLGIGYFIEKYKSFADYRCVLAGIVTVGVITTVIDILVNKAEKTLIRWEE